MFCSQSHVLFRGQPFHSPRKNSWNCETTADWVDFRRSLLCSVAFRITYWYHQPGIFGTQCAVLVDISGLFVKVVVQWKICTSLCVYSLRYPALQTIIKCPFSQAESKNGIFFPSTLIFHLGNSRMPMIREVMLTASTASAYPAYNIKDKPTGTTFPFQSCKSVLCTTSLITATTRERVPQHVCK